MTLKRKLLSRSNNTPIPLQNTSNRINMFDAVNIGKNNTTIAGTEIINKLISIKLYPTVDRCGFESFDTINYLCDSLFTKINVGDPDLDLRIAYGYISMKINDYDTILTGNNNITKVGTYSDPTYFDTCTNVDPYNYTYLYKSISAKPIKLLGEAQDDYLTITMSNPVSKNDCIGIDLRVYVNYIATTN